MRWPRENLRILIITSCVIHLFTLPWYILGLKTIGMIRMAESSLYYWSRKAIELLENCYSGCNDLTSHNFCVFWVQCLKMSDRVNAGLSCIQIGGEHYGWLFLIFSESGQRTSKGFSGVRRNDEKFVFSWQFIREEWYFPMCQNVFKSFLS